MNKVSDCFGQDLTDNTPRLSRCDCYAGSGRDLVAGPTWSACSTAAKSNTAWSAKHRPHPQSTAWQNRGVNRRRSKKAQQRLAGLYDDNARLVTALLRAGADPNRPDAEGVTPLYRASVQGNARNVRILLAAGARPNDECSEGLPLCAAACWDHSAAVSLLLAGGADSTLRESDSPYYSAEEWAARSSH